MPEYESKITHYTKNQENLNWNEKRQFEYASMTQLLKLSEELKQPS